MAVIKLAGFTGEAPRVTPRLLPATAAQIAESVRLEDGELSPFRQPFAEEVLAVTPGAVKSIYRHLGDWLAWETIVHAVPGPVAEDRLYFTGDGVPKMLAGGVTYSLALTAPAGALVATNGSPPGTVYETRLYVYTYVTDFGEESEPSPVSNAVEVAAGQTVTLSGFAAAPGGRNFTKQRIYRSQTGLSGSTQFFFVAERAASASDYIDSVTPNFAETLPSTHWNPPPTDLKCLTSMPNGMMAGISGKELCFCEPFRPHAWPEKYRITLDYEGVALAVIGTTLVVGTKGHPYMISGTHPDSMVSEKMELNLPCLGARGMVDLGYAVAYPSYDGLVVVQGGSASVATGSLFTRDQWLKMDPATMVCGQFYGRLLASYEYTDIDGADVAGTLILDLTGESPFLIRSRHKADAMFYELTSGALYMVFGDTIYEWDSRQAVNDTFTWRSKVFVLPAPTNFGAIYFEIDQGLDPDATLAIETETNAIIAANEALFAGGALGGELNGSLVNQFTVNGDILAPLPVGPRINVNIYADGQFVATVSRAGRMVRLPAGRMAREWEIEVSGNAALVELTMASTALELRNV
jgi:hypothetical protein